MPVFRVTWPYLNLLEKPRIFFRFSGKNTILCILKGEIPFKMHKIILFSRKKICVPTPYLNCSYLLPETTHIIFWAIFMLLFLSADFFQKKKFSKNLSGTLSDCVKWFGSWPLSVLIWVRTVWKGYQQMTKVTTSKEGVKSTIIFLFCKFPVATWLRRNNKKKKCVSGNRSKNFR